MTNIMHARAFKGATYGLVIAGLLLSTFGAGYTYSAQAKKGGVPADPATDKGVGGIDAECQAHGFDFGIAKWEYNGGWSPEGDPNGTTVTGDDDTADWTADPAVDGVIVKHGQNSDVLPGGTAGSVDVEKGISHITFCGNEGEGCEEADLIFTFEPDFNLPQSFWVAGEACLLDTFPNSHTDVTTINMPSDGTFDSYSEVLRGGAGEHSQPLEEFTLTVGGDTGPNVVDAPADVVLQLQYTGEFDFVAGDNDITMDTTAPQCNGYEIPNSVHVVKLCLFEVED